MIAIYRGEDTDFAGAGPIQIKIETDLDLTGFTAEILFGNVVKSFDSEEVATKTLGLVFSSEETSGFFPGKGYATVKVYDTEGRIAFLKRFVIDVRFRNEGDGEVDLAEAIQTMEDIKSAADALKDLTEDDDIATVKDALNKFLSAAREKTEFKELSGHDKLLVGTKKAFDFISFVKKIEAIALNIGELTENSDTAEVKKSINELVTGFKS